MFGTIITAGVGTVMFRVGMNAQKRLANGDGLGTVALEAAKDTCKDVASASKWCYDLFCDTFVPGHDSERRVEEARKKE